MATEMIHLKILTAKILPKNHQRTLTIKPLTIKLGETTARFFPRAAATMSQTPKNLL